MAPQVVQFSDPPTFPVGLNPGTLPQYPVAAPRIAVNGFGRIGRLAVRALLELPDEVDLVAVNDRTDNATLANLLRHDSIHGPFPGTVEAVDDGLVVDGDRLRVFKEDTPHRLPWQKLGVEVVIEASGRHRDRPNLEAHLAAGARRVLLTAPGDVDVAIVPGVNDDALDLDRHRIVGAASCTTNALAPVLAVLDDAFGVERGLMTTIHAVTADQRLTDGPHHDPRRARAAWLSMIPTTTGAARAVGEVLPHLTGRVDGLAVRVPVADVSLVDLTAQLREPPRDAGDLAKPFLAAQDRMPHILGCDHEPLVSIDHRHDDRSVVVDLPSLMVAGSHVKILAWYDNEWAYARRVAEIALRLTGGL